MLSLTILLTTTSPPFGLAPSATTTMLKRLPLRFLSFTLAAMISASYGISGIRMMSPPPATPECSAIHPAFRPMTSTIMTRW